MRHIAFSVVFGVVFFAIVCKALNFQTRIRCCTLGTNYSSSGLDCKSFQPPIEGIEKQDETQCLSVVDVCCKKQFRLMQCEVGKNDAKSGTCVEDDGERKECCGACQLGIESGKAGDPCIDNFGLGVPYSDAFISCCQQPNMVITNPSTSTTTTSTTPKTKVSDETVEDYYRLPGLSEENVCETGEFCAQLCEPSGESYRCACFKGYVLMEDGVSCKPEKRVLKKGGRCDIQNPCDHDCIDTGTAIKCACREGYELAPDKRTCKDIDECALKLHDCKPNEECFNEEGGFDCYIPDFSDPEADVYENKCPTGYKFNSEKLVCDDIDECQFGIICVPPKVCKNSIGSFTCEGEDSPRCPPGFYYKPAIDTCADIDECVSGENDCNKESQVCLNTKGNYTCIDKASRNTCPPGFKKNHISSLCEDIDECQENFEACKPNEKCINEPGGHTCIAVAYEKSTTSVKPTPSQEPRTPPTVKCPKGFVYNAKQNTCDDINECENDTEACDSNQVCYNTPGSYTCNCKTGFTKDFQTEACVDINECQLGTHDCKAAERCDNTIGSFHCSRIFGCGTGYTLNYANGLCEDDDECFLGTHHCNRLGPNFKCINLLGSYRCEAVRPTRTYATKPTYATPTKLPVNPHSNLPNVTAMPPDRPPTNVEHTSSPPTIISETPIRVLSTTPRPYNSPPSVYYTPSTQRQYPSSTYTTPKSFYVPPRTYPTYPRFNPTEPTKPNYIPFSAPTQTTTFITGIRKQCLPGYIMNSNGDCEDINECDSNPCPKGQKCLNFNGRFECAAPKQCKMGYELNDAREECIDVNECSRGTHKCNPTQICKNGDGYYTCECPPGHFLSRSSQMCEDIDECKYYRPCGISAECINTKGSYECSCSRGFRKTHSKCDDINECNENPGLCEHSCVNTWGSFRCACKSGFTLSSDNRTCSDIDECDRFKDRKLCIGSCKNVPGSYVCECPKGYKLGSDGRVCIDIDECQQNVCSYDEVCLNTRGAFKCYRVSCPKNYVKDADKPRCKRLQAACDLRDYQCLSMPDQYTYQYMSLVSNLPVSDGHIRLFQIKVPAWAKAEFSLTLVEVICPPGVQRVDDSYFQKSKNYESMQLFLVRSMEGPQEVKLEVGMKLYQEGTLIGNFVVYVIIAVSEYTY